MKTIKIIKQDSGDFMQVIKSVTRDEITMFDINDIKQQLIDNADKIANLTDKQIHLNSIIADYTAQVATQ